MPGQLGALYRGTMLLTEESTRDGHVRIYATQQASIVSYFEDDGEGGTTLQVEPGEFASPLVVTPERMAALKEAVLSEVARRLSCPADKVLGRSMAELSLIADPLLNARHTWSGRRHTRHATR